MAEGQVKGRCQVVKSKARTKSPASSDSDFLELSSTEDECDSPISIPASSIRSTTYLSRSSDSAIRLGSGKPPLHPFTRERIIAAQLQIDNRNISTEPNKSSTARKPRFKLVNRPL